MSEQNDFENADSREFWAAAADGRLVFQQCDACKAIQFPPRQNCRVCWHDRLSWRDSSGEGTVESFTIIERAPTAAFRDKVPYTVAAVRVAEGPLMITNIIGDDALGVQVGDAVSVAFEPDAKGNELPQFKRTTG